MTFIRPATSPPLPRRRALALSEVLLCAAISSLLLTAVALAFRASFNSYKDSQERGRLINAARSCLTQFTLDVRDGDCVYSSQTASGYNAIKIQKFHADLRDPQASASYNSNVGYFIFYWFDPTTQGIYCARGSLNATPYLVCPYVQSWTISPNYPNNAGTSTPTATISFVLANKDTNGQRLIQDGSQNLSLTFSASAVARRDAPGI